MADNYDFDAEELYRRSIESIPVSEGDYLAPADDDGDVPCQDVPYDQAFNDYGSVFAPSQPAQVNTGAFGADASRRNGNYQNAGQNYRERNASGSGGVSSGDATYLNVPFSEKDEAKSLGARWDKNVKKWYVPAGIPLDGFSKWM